MAFRPDKLTYFEGEQELDPVTIPGLPEKGRTVVRHWAGWQWLFGVEVLCDGEVTERVKKRRGMTIEHREDLEATVKASGGLEFITKLEAGLKGSKGRTLTLEREVVEEKEVVFRGKDCFVSNVNLYQLYSRLEVECEWKTMLGKAKYWKKEGLIWHQRYAHRKDPVEPADRECGCGLPPGAQVEPMEVGSEHLSMAEPFFVLNRQLIFFTLGLAVEQGVVKPFDADKAPPFWPPVQQVERDWSVDPQRALEEQLEPFLMADLPFPAYVLPEYLRFLGGVAEADTITLNFSVPAIAGPA